MLRARKPGSHLVFVIVTLLSLSGCVALTGETAGENVDDTVITTEIKAKLAAEKAVYTTRVGVKTERGVVHLTGSVTTADEKSRVVKIAKAVTGVREVVDRLEVRP